jgi:hypothetical protein
MNVYLWLNLVCEGGGGRMNGVENTSDSLACGGGGTSENSVEKP